MLTSGRTKYVLLGTLVASFGILLALRLYGLSADPPLNMHVDFLTDEGWWAHNARLRVQFGNWIMDESNSALIGSPLYTLILHWIYEFFGVGIVQTRIMAAISGIATCTIVFLAVRSLSSFYPAILSTLFLGFNYFMLTNNRVGFVESFQLVLITSCCLSLVLALKRPVWAFASGLFFVLAVLAKLSSLSLLGVIILYLATQFWLSHRDGHSQSATFRTALLFSLAAGGAGILLLLSFVLPNLDLVLSDLKNHLNQSDYNKSITNFLILGFDPYLGAISGFVLQTPVLLTIMFLLLTKWIASSRKLPRDPLTLMNICWIVGTLLSFGPQDWVPERRYMQLLPAISILAGTALWPSGLSLISRRELSGPKNFWIRAGIGATLGGLLGIYLRHPSIVQTFQEAAFGLPLGDGPGLSVRATAGIILLGSILIGSAAGPIFCRILPVRCKAISLRWIIAIFLLVNVGRFGVYASDLTYTIQEAGHRLSEVIESRVENCWEAVGLAADTLTMGLPIFAFHIREWNHWPHYMNVEGWDQFRPDIVIGDSPRERGFKRLPDLELSPDSSGKPRFRLPLWVREIP